MRIYVRGRNSDGSRSNAFTDITPICGAVTMQGEVKAASRQLRFEVLRKDLDYYLSGLGTLNRGDGVLLTDGDTPDPATAAFFGVVWSVSENDSEMRKTVTCYDNMKFLMTSDTITSVWTGVTPGEVTETVCKELGVTCGDLAECDVKVNVNARDRSGYEAIMIAWTEARKQTEKYYYPRMVGYKLSVIEKGERLDDKALVYKSEPLPCSLINVEVEEDSADAVTSLWERNSSGTPHWKENNDEWVKLYGYIVGMNDTSEQTTRQDSVKVLSDGKKSVTVSAVGDWAVQTGWSVSLLSNVLTSDTLYIERDSHTYENGIHTMSLTLSYENSMDEVEQQEIEQKSSEFREGYTVEETIWNFLRASGFDAEAAAGVMGNMWAESNCTADQEQIGGGGGYGLCQWTGPRRTDLVNWCQSNGYDYTSLMGQLNFMMHEIEAYGLEHLKTADSVEAATRAWLDDFEKAGIERWNVRISAANDYYSRWKDYDEIPLSSGSAEGDGVYTGSVGWPFIGGAGTVMQTYSPGGHRGWDISTTGGYGAGSPVVAVEGGTVVGAGYQLDDWSYGNAVTIQHTNGFCTRYAHLYSINVVAGQKVSKGQQIGVEGNTGNSQGTHLHIEFLNALPWGSLYDPGNYLNRNG